MKQYIKYGVIKSRNNIVLRVTNEMNDKESNLNALTVLYVEAF